MARTIVNLVDSIVQSEVEHILDSDQRHPYPIISQSPTLRKRLVGYVISRTPGCYAVVDDTAPFALNVDSFCCASDLRQQIRDLIHQGVVQLAQESGEMPGTAPGITPGTTVTRTTMTVTRTDVSKSESRVMAPSSWFG
jgi:hypothetical protein